MIDEPIDMSEGAEASPWEQRFETQINTFFDEAISRVPAFVDRHLKSFRKVMARSVSPRTGVGDILVGLRNVASGVSKSLGGPDFDTTSYTHDALTKAFEREVVSPEELETLLTRLFAEFEDDMWKHVAEKAGEQHDFEHDQIDRFRARLQSTMEEEIGHDPLLAQAIRSGVKIGVPATLGYVLFGRFSLGDAAGEIYKRNLNLYHRTLLKLGRFKVPGWIGAVGWAGGILGTLAVGGLMEYTLNSVRDVKGQYIRQLNTARYVLLYGEDPDDPEGRGLLHIVRGLERRFERVPEKLTPEALDLETPKATGEGR